MKKIVYLGNKLSKKGKTETSIESLSDFLIQDGFDVVTASDKRNMFVRLFHMCYVLIANSRTADYVLIDTYSTLNFYYAYIISLLCRIVNLKYIPILRGGNLPLRLINNPNMSRAIFNNAYTNVSPSDYLKSVFGEQGYSNVICIPNSIDIINYDFYERKIKIPKILWVRSFSEIYNPEMAIEVVKELKANQLDYELCMVGPEVDGSMSKAKKLAKELGIKVTFTGKLPKEDWIELSKNYNIFINTTNFDNMPLSVLEAMALGLPVVSTNVGGIPFLMQDNMDGYLVGKNDVSGMANKIM
ncbi:MAG: glycosyltransferase family 4 protein, partial [Flavobacteriaceae bacterium]|nr:glycosyltransferase family 4 protein [Flavobacteriaceae bacterium]